MTTVLLAEDEELLRTMIVRVLGRHGLRVLAAVDGVQAVALFREHVEEIDIVVLDVRMPRLEGPQALAQIRVLRPGIPAVLTSGFAHPNEYLAQLLRDGVHFLPKPLRVAALAKLIGEVMGVAIAEPPPAR